MSGNLFKDKGIKNTKHRCSVLEILEKYDHPISADEIYELLKQKDININLSTVYRVLELFYEKEIALRVMIFNDKKYSYELNRQTHRHYLVCIKCSSRIEIGHCPLDDFEKKLTQETHYKIMGHKLDVYGCCPKCLEADEC